jgi:2,4-dienoyl-CoA reductase-like NADH-dependent reductase (Old Yellow Enzyme family)/thioredoxin reductase
MMLLEQPGRLGPLQLKNRVTLAPMGTNYSTCDGLTTERDKLYYTERARGGVAMIMTAAMGVTGDARAHRNTPVCYHDRFIPGLASLVSAIKAHECHVFGQLNHHGALLHEKGMDPVGPSPWINPKTGAPVKPLTVGEILDIQKHFAGAAQRLWIAGYDGVEVHAANGYLFHQFFAPRINRRTDRYGGSVENRMRFLLETVARIQDKAPGLLVMVRFSVTEFIEGGYSDEDVIVLSKALEKAGVVALDLSAGSNETPQLSKFCIQTASFPRAFLASYAKRIKDAVSIPVIVAGRIVEPQDAEAILASGSADFISLGRALYADPHWYLKASGRVKAPIRGCIACNVCHERLTSEQDVACVQNPMMGTEFESLDYAEPQLTARKAPARRRVLVLGAGVSGLECARVAAGRGHHVEVWERSERLGGQLDLAVAAPGKHEVKLVWSYRWEEIQALGVSLRTGVDATTPRIRSFNPDLVVLATGAVPREPAFSIEALSADVRVHHAWEFLRRPDLVEREAHVTVVGGGTAGMETADLLVSRGCSVTLIEATGVIAGGMSRSNRREALDRLSVAGVSIVLNAQVIEASNSVLKLRMLDGDVRSHDIGEYLLIALGARPNTDAISAVADSGARFVTIGDCYKPGDFMSCIRDAWMVGLTVQRYI